MKAVTTSDKVRFGAIVLMVVLLGATGVLAQGLSVAGFVVPAAGGTTEVADAVESPEEGVVASSDAQDAFNHANNSLVQSGEGFSIVEFPSGIGFVASGTSFYETFENENASYLSKRVAYVQAYTVAKAQLAQGLHGSRTRGTDAVRRYVAAMDDAQSGGANVQNVTEEQITAVVSGMLRGHVVYDVRDDTEARQIFVSVAVSPRSTSAIDNISEGVVSVESLVDGIAYVLNKIENGVTPPAGSTLVMVPHTGETAIVGFGSAMARRNDNQTIENQLRQAAVRAAELRSHDAIISMISGDQVVWRTGLYEQTRDEATQFLEIVDDVGTWQGDAELLEETRSDFVSFIEMTDDYISIRDGRLPPGIQSQTYWDGSWAYVVSLYLPSASREASKFRFGMLSGSPEQPGEAVEVPRGPTGRVTDDDEL